MVPSDNCVSFVASFEGFRPTAYLCPANVWTIGYGTTKNVKQGDTINEEEAKVLLRLDLMEAADAICDWVDVPLTQNQFDALCSLVYNIGRNAFKGSTLLKLLNAGNYLGAAQQFGRWVKGGGKELPGLVRRRKAERELFEKE
jgi:lysozyme